MNQAVSHLPIEQRIVIKVNQIIYKAQSLCFHHDLTTGTYKETFTGMELTLDELLELCKVIEESNLRKVKPILYWAEDDQEQPFLYCAMI